MFWNGGKEEGFALVLVMFVCSPFFLALTMVVCQLTSIRSTCLVVLRKKALLRFYPWVVCLSTLALIIACLFTNIYLVNMFGGGKEEGLTLSLTMGCLFINIY